MGSIFTETVRFCEYHQHNFKSKRLGECVTFFWTLTPNNPAKNILRFTIVPESQNSNFAVVKILVIDRNGRVVPHKKLSNLQIECKFDGKTLLNGTRRIKYWVKHLPNKFGYWFSNEGFYEKHTCIEEWIEDEDLNKT